MPFGNPILGGKTLIREAEQSENYVPGGAGWRLARNGDAEVNDLRSRGLASGESASYDTLSANDEFYYKGNALEDIQALFNHGIAKYGTAATDSSPYGTTETELASLYPECTKGHVYKVTITCAVRLQNCSYADLILRIEQTAQYVTTSSTQYQKQYQQPTGSASNVLCPVTIISLFKATKTGFIGIGLFGVAGNGSAYIEGTSDPLRFIVEDEGLNDITNFINLHNWQGPSGNNPPPSDPPSKHYDFRTRSNVYSYEQNGDILSDGTNKHAYQGDYGGYGGNRYSLIYFNGLHSEVDGISQDNILEFKLEFTMEHTYSSSGADVYLGYYSTTGTYHRRLVHHHFYEGQNLSVNLHGTEIEDALRTGYLSAFLLGPAPNHNVDYYCYADGTGGKGAFYLRLTWLE